MSSEQIEDVMSALNDMGINIVESAEADEDDEERTRTPSRRRRGRRLDDGGPRLEKKKETVDRTDDPVRMYLREMGAVELLSREGEIAIAKRIEAGRDTMIWGLCESPITFNAIIGWSNALNEGRMQLREILDLEAMLSKGPTAEQADREGGEAGDEARSARRTAGPSIKEEEEVAEEPVADEDEDDEDMVERRTAPQAEEEDEDNTLVASPRWRRRSSRRRSRSSPRSPRSYKKFSKVQAHAHGRDERRRGLRAPATSASSARSSTWSRRASARRARPRRRWSRPTCASSSRSPRNTPTAACSSST
jgi:RNA polymerase primary sigma factor